MKKIVFTTTLLSIVMCENILLENHPRSKELWVCNNQFWCRNMKRAPCNGLSSELVKFVNRNDDEQLPRILETRFISESKKSPVTIIRQPDTTRFSQDLLSPEKLKFNRFKPTIFISIGIEETKSGDNLKEDCSKKKSHHKNKQNWQIQQPIYVEEPKWIAIDSDNIDGTSRRLDDTDSYILSRGKKIFSFKDSEQVNKLIENNEGFIKNNKEVFDYPSRSKRSSTKSRAKRSVGTNENSRKNAVNKKDNWKEKINCYNSLQSIDRGAKRKNENNYFASNTNKRSKRSILLKSKTFPEIYKKHRTHKLNWMNAKSKGERNETDMFEQMEKIYVDKLDDLHDVYDDSYILSRGKHMFDSRTESSNKTYASHGEATYKKPWKDLETSENKEKRNKSSILEIEKNTTEKINSQLTHKPAKISAEKNIDSNYREKRDVCKSLVCKLEPQLPNQWLLKSFEEEIQDTLSLERRDKTSEFLKKLTGPSFVISRGKKALRSKFEDDLYSMFQSRNIKMVSLPIVKSLLRMLLMEKYNNSNGCDVDVSKLVGRRDRRDSLDIFTKEEPFYVGRGKRMESDGFLTQSLQRENIILPETDAKQ